MHMSFNMALRKVLNRGATTLGWELCECGNVRGVNWAKCVIAGDKRAIKRVTASKVSCMQSCEKTLHCRKNILFYLVAASLLWRVHFALKYSSNLDFIHFLRWIVSPSSFRVTESCTGRHQDCLHQDPGRPRMWRSLLSAVWSYLHSRRELCMRSRSDLISMSFKAWTVNPGQQGQPRKVWKRRSC